MLSSTPLIRDWILFPSPLVAGNRVEVNVGEPVEIPSEICAKCYAAGVEQGEVWSQITAVIEAAVRGLEATSPPNTDQTNGQERNKATGGEQAKPNAA
jgi:hypothetical protein